MDDMPLENLRLNSPQRGGDDGDHPMDSSTLVTLAPILQSMVQDTLNQNASSAECIGSFHNPTFGHVIKSYFGAN